MTLNNMNGRGKKAHKLDSGRSTATEALSIWRAGETSLANGRSGFEGAESTIGREVKCVRNPPEQIFNAVES